MFIFQAVFEWAFERPLFVTRIESYFHIISLLFPIPITTTIPITVSTTILAIFIEVLIIGFLIIEVLIFGILIIEVHNT